MQTRAFRIQCQEEGKIWGSCGWQARLWKERLDQVSLTSFLLPFFWAKFSHNVSTLRVFLPIQLVNTLHQSLFPSINPLSFNPGKRLYYPGTSHKSHSKPTVFMIPYSVWTYFSSYSCALVYVDMFNYKCSFQMILFLPFVWELSGFPMPHFFSLSPHWLSQK